MTPLKGPSSHVGSDRRIRAFEEASDLSEVYALWRRAGPGIHLSRSDDPEEIRKKLQRDPDLFLVAEEDGRIVGTVMGGYDGRRGMVYHLAVEADRRRAGIGTQLMEELEDRLRAKGCLKYYLLVAEDNPEAIEFYQRLGWVEMPHHLMGKELS